MRFRIGVNLGDVMVEGSDIYGDGVNIAARLQEWPSRAASRSPPVYDQVHNKLSLGFDCLGQQQMKNVAPVISYRVAMGGEAVGRSSPQLAKALLPRMGSSLELRRFTASRETRAGHVNALLSLHWLADRADCYAPGCCGLSGCDRCFHGPAQDLVPLASRNTAVHCHPTDGEPAQTRVGQKKERRADRERGPTTLVCLLLPAKRCANRLRGLR